MPTINLLPWREELRQKRKKDFLLALVGAMLMGGLLAYGTKLFYKAQISEQQARNQILRNEISLLDEQIAEIEQLDAQKARLLARMEIIDQLQRSRPEVVHLFDELASILPEGMSLTSIEQQGMRITMNGNTQSSTRVSTLLRNIDEESEWLTSSALGIVEGEGESRQFRVAASQVPISDEETIQ